MAWIEVHQTLTRHPKLLRLSAKLRIHRAQSAGHLISLWLWTLDYAPTGDLSAFGPAEISAAADYPGDPEVFAQALRDFGWIDEDGHLHDWMDYAGRLVEKRAANRERMKDARATHVQRTTDACAGATVPNRTVPYRTKEKNKSVLGLVDPGNLMPAKPDPDNLEATRETLAKAVAKRKPKTLIPPDWTLKPEIISWCAEHRLPEPESQRLQFVTYWQGRGEARADWDATFRNWMTSPFRKDRTNGNGNGHRPNLGKSEKNSREYPEALTL